ncbi:hypothetical protein MRX96_033384 [Rhipicephalus microplus]
MESFLSLMEEPGSIWTLSGGCVRVDEDPPEADAKDRVVVGPKAFCINHVVVAATGMFNAEVFLIKYITGLRDEDLWLTSCIHCSLDHDGLIGFCCHYSTRAELANVLRSDPGFIAVVDNVSEDLEVKSECGAVVAISDAWSFRGQLLNIHLRMGAGCAVESPAGVARVKDVAVTTSGQSPDCLGWALHFWLLQ